MTPSFQDTPDAPSPSATPDSIAVDRWLDAHAGEGPPASLGDARVGRLAWLLSKLELPPWDEISRGPGDANAGNARDTLVDVTFARVLRSPRSDLAGRIVAPSAAPMLGGPSAEGVDAHFGARASSDAERRARAAAVCSLLDAGLDAPTPEERDSLIATTLARIQSEIESSQRQFRLSPTEESLAAAPRGLIRFSDLGSIAAIFLVAAAVLWPMLLNIREQAREAQCAANLGRAALGFTLYAADHKGELPRAEASLLGGSWWNVGRDSRSHSANLYRLVTGGYASLSDLSCPGNAQAPTIRLNFAATDWRNPEEVSFSYQLFGSRPPLWSSSHLLVVLTDRSPVVERARKGERFDAEASSLNHNGHGQNILFSDGAVRLIFRPVLPNGDNIWLPASFNPSQFLTGRERPANDRDAFVGP